MMLCVFPCVQSSFKIRFLIPAASGGDGLMNFDEFCCHLHENYSEEVSTLCLYLYILPSLGTTYIIFFDTFFRALAMSIPSALLIDLERLRQSRCC